MSTHWEFNNILNKIKGSDSPYVKVIFTDLSGHLRGLHLSKEKFIYYSKNYIPLEPLHFPQNTLSDCYLNISFDSCRFISWDNQTPLFLANLIRKNSHEYCPRSLLLKAAEKFDPFKIKPYIKWSIEWTLYSEPIENLIQKTPNQLRPTEIENVNYDLIYNQQNSQFINIILKELQNFDIEVDQLFTQSGYNRYKIVLESSPALEAADQLTLLKIAFKEISYKHKMYISFQSFFNSPSNIQTSPPLSADIFLRKHETEKNYLKSLAKKSDLNNFISSLILGVLDHSITLSSIYNPNINSFKDIRHHPHIQWGVNDPNCFLNYNTKSYSLCLNLNNAEANPYLLLVSTLESALAGEKKYKDKAPLVLKQREGQPIKYPQSLVEALKHLESQEAESLLPKAFIKEYQLLKKKEWATHESSSWQRINF